MSEAPVGVITDAERTRYHGGGDVDDEACGLSGA